MKKGWVVAWEGGTCHAYLTEAGDWTFDPDEARIWRSWFSATRASLQTKGRVVRCWFEEE